MRREITEYIVYEDNTSIHHVELKVTSWTEHLAVCGGFYSGKPASASVNAEQNISIIFFLLFCFPDRNEKKKKSANHLLLEQLQHMVICLLQYHFRAFRLLLGQNLIIWNPSVWWWCYNSQPQIPTSMTRKRQSQSQLFSHQAHDSRWF